MSVAHTVEIKDEEIEAYRRDGVVVLREVIGEDWIELLREAAEKDLAEPGPDADIYSKPGEPLQFYDYDMWKRIPEFRDYAFNSPAGEIAARLMGASEVYFYYDRLSVLEPGTWDSTTIWHHDQIYWPLAGRQICSTWVPLDPILSESGVVFVKGSHHWEGGLFALFDSAPDGKRLKDSKPEQASDTHPRRGKPELLSWDLEPGDCLVWRTRILHKGRSNQSLKNHRRAVDLSWFGDDVTYSARDPKANLPDAYFGLRHGEPMRNSKACPRVWPRSD